MDVMLDKRVRLRVGGGKQVCLLNNAISGHSDDRLRQADVFSLWVALDLRKAFDKVSKYTICIAPKSKKNPGAY